MRILSFIPSKFRVCKAERGPSRHLVVGGKGEVSGDTCRLFTLPPFSTPGKLPNPLGHFSWPTQESSSFGSPSSLAPDFSPVWEGGPPGRLCLA